MSRHHFRGLCATIVLLAAPLTVSTGSAAIGPQDSYSQPCSAKNTSTGVTGSDLQEAIDAAQSGDLIRVGGTCVGGFAFANDVTLVGPATLSGEECFEIDGELGCSAQTVVVVNEGNVKLKNLVVTDGYGTAEGGGIVNSGNLILSSTAVRGNWAEDGGGGILNEGTMMLNWSSSVTDNWLLFGNGGGILNRGTVILNAWTRVERNDRTQLGGGIYNEGTVVLNRAASVTDNVADVAGGAIYNDDGNVWFSRRWHGTLCGNTPDDWPTC